MTSNAKQIAALNDAFRRGETPGRRYLSASVGALNVVEQMGIALAVSQFDSFTPDNDPYGEHDFGSLTWAEQTIFWKIDVYADNSLTMGAEDYADPKAVRVLTIMFAEDW